MNNLKDLKEKIEEILFEFEGDAKKGYWHEPRTVKELIFLFASHSEALCREVIGENEIPFISTKPIGMNVEGKPLFDQFEYAEKLGRNTLRAEQRERLKHISKGVGK